jgi:hypothetical protein
MSIESTGKEHRKFETGAERDSEEGKGLPALISPIFTDRLAKHLEAGAAKYEARNWEKGIPVEASLNSLERHVIAIKEGRNDEDHMAAIACNIMFMIHTKEMVERGLLPKSLDFNPNYLIPEDVVGEESFPLDGPDEDEDAESYGEYVDDYHTDDNKMDNDADDSHYKVGDKVYVHEHAPSTYDSLLGKFAEIAEREYSPEDSEYSGWWYRLVDDRNQYWYTTDQLALVVDTDKCQTCDILDSCCKIEEGGLVVIKQLDDIRDRYDATDGPGYGDGMEDESGLHTVKRVIHVQYSDTPTRYIVNHWQWLRADLVRVEKKGN